ncbi:venom allergen-like (VAL) 7 protein, partial [Schistosoma mansoni]|uniref:venom allergen-like (VAL) 7 protein n=1 Tax=Schistosoma mansoni TaxID=6183 RepID=UPI00022C8683
LQLAFADTTHIGCGYAMCFNLTGLDKVFVVCNYVSRGKYANRQPYDPIYPEDPYYLP